MALRSAVMLAVARGVASDGCSCQAGLLDPLRAQLEQSSQELRQTQEELQAQKDKARLLEDRMGGMETRLEELLQRGVEGPVGTSAGGARAPTLVGRGRQLSHDGTRHAFSHRGESVTLVASEKQCLSDWTGTGVYVADPVDCIPAVQTGGHQGAGACAGNYFNWAGGNDGHCGCLADASTDCSDVALQVSNSNTNIYSIDTPAAETSVATSAWQLHVVPETCTNMLGHMKTVLLPEVSAGGGATLSWSTSPTPDNITGNLTLSSLAQGSWATSEIQTMPYPFKIIHDAACTAAPVLQLPLHTDIETSLSLNGLTLLTARESTAGAPSIAKSAYLSAREPMLKCRSLPAAVLWMEDPNVDMRDDCEGGDITNCPSLTWGSTRYDWFGKFLQNKDNKCLHVQDDYNVVKGSCNSLSGYEFWYFDGELLKNEANGPGMCMQCGTASGVSMETCNPSNTAQQWYWWRPGDPRG